MRVAGFCPMTDAHPLAQAKATFDLCAWSLPAFIGFLQMIHAAYAGDARLNTAVSCRRLAC